MISIDEHPPPDPSSSLYQNQQHQVSYEALDSTVSSDVDLLIKPKDAITLDHTNYNPHPNFSIRDYVYGSRCKKNNWPFSQKSLQLCLNYSGNNVLPPFESLDSLRTTNQSISVENHFPNEESLAHTKSNSQQPTVKKCNLVMKLISDTEPAVEETVASKLCPVCKTFSSSSNTTLNAHIDQCLSEESCSMKSTSNPKMKTRKHHRIKPRKTRLLVDILKAAVPCTVEELERRNGRNWATNSNFPDQELDQVEEKKEEPTFNIPKVADHEGAVYIDTNGTKFRILSIDKQLDDDHNARKLQKGEGSKFVKGKKTMKVYRLKKRQKILKLSPNSKKATSGQKENGATLGSQKKDGGENPMKAQENKQMDNNNIVSVTRPPWACSKRTSVAKKRFPVLTKPKEGTGLGGRSENPSIIVNSKGCNKLSSLEKNVLVSATSPEHNAAGSKLILKRKFSVLKKPQDHWTQTSRMEKDSEVKKTKQSIASKKSNGNGDSSSGGFENITTETATIEDPFHADRHGNIEGNFMGLSKSLDDELSKIAVQPENKSDPVDEIMMGHMNKSTEKEENYLEKVEVDPIMLPGPQGSLLRPSPGTEVDDMLNNISEEDHQANSSLTTTGRIHDSNEDQLINHDLMIKTDFISDSPVSTISSPSFARSGCDKYLSSRLIITSQQHDKKSVNSSNHLGSSVDASSFTEKQEHQESPDLELNLGPKCIDFMPDNLFSLRSPPPETAKSRVDASAVKLPVLRLMGKNLTVVKTDDDLQEVVNDGSMHHVGFNLHPPNNNDSFHTSSHHDLQEVVNNDGNFGTETCYPFMSSI